MLIQTINPVTEAIIANYPCMTEQEVFSIIERSAETFTFWSRENIQSRAEKMHKAGELLIRDKSEYGRLITLEMGKPLQAAIEEIEKCARVCQYYADNAQNFLLDHVIKTEFSKSFVSYHPLGTIFAIMPWNFPFWQVFRFAAPTLMAGNCALLKHAPNTTGSGLAIEKIFRDAGFPEHAFRTLVIDNDVSAKVIEHPAIAAVTLTGSNRTGEIVGSLAGQHVKKVVLELGGNDPYIILEDADLALAADAVIASRMNNAGQSCIAAKRILAVAAIRDEFQQLIMEKLNQWQPGDPMDAGVKMGPLARADLRETVHKQVQESVEKGAKILAGGFIPDRPGFYYPPTVLTNIHKDMPAYKEELFGPVISFIDVIDENEAITIANDTPFGLSAAIFTQDLYNGERIAVEKIRAGTVFINNFVRSDPRLPFGGIKASGHGRELSHEGMLEFVNIKTICVQ